MRKAVLFLLIGISCFGQDQKAKLLFVDGTSWDGYAKMISNEKIKFRFNPEEKATVWTSDELLGVEFYNDICFGED